MSSFTITTPEAAVNLRPSSVKPGETAKGTVTYGVTNKTGVTIRTGLRIKPGEGAQEAWFTVRGGDERDIAPGATESFAVDLSVPGVSAPGGRGGSGSGGRGGSGASEAGTPAKYSFAAVAVNLRDPDNDFESGSAIAFVAPALEQDDGGIKIKWWMIAAPVALLLVVGGALWALWPDSAPQRVTLANFEGSLLADARSALTSQGYSVEEIALSVGAPEFDRQQFYDQIVTEQTPESDGTTPIERPDKVQLGWEWKPKKVTVPNVVDSAFGPAVTAIEKAGLRYVGAIGPVGNPPSTLHYAAVASVSPTGQQDAGTGITFTMKWKQGLRIQDVVILQQQFEAGKSKVSPRLDLRTRIPQ